MPTTRCNGSLLVSPLAERAYNPAKAKAIAKKTVTAYNVHMCPRHILFISSQIP